MDEQIESTPSPSMQNFDAGDEVTDTKINSRRRRMIKFLDNHKKHIFFAYVFVGIVLFYLLISKPVLRDPYLIEIFNR